MRNTDFELEELLHSLRDAVGVWNGSQSLKDYVPIEVGGFRVIVRRENASCDSWRSQVRKAIEKVKGGAQLETADLCRQRLGCTSEELAQILAVAKQIGVCKIFTPTEPLPSAYNDWEQPEPPKALEKVGIKWEVGQGRVSASK